MPSILTPLSLTIIPHHPITIRISRFPQKSPRLKKITYGPSYCTNKLLTVHWPSHGRKTNKKSSICVHLFKKIRNPKIWKKPRQPTKTPIFMPIFAVTLHVRVWYEYYKISGPVFSLFKLSFKSTVFRYILFSEPLFVTVSC